MTDDAEKVRKLGGWDGPIKKGDVVYLKPGSPGMTVSSLKSDSVECVWFARAMLTKQPTGSVVNRGITTGRKGELRRA